MKDTFALSVVVLTAASAAALAEGVTEGACYADCADGLTAEDDRGPAKGEAAPAFDAVLFDPGTGQADTRSLDDLIDARPLILAFGSFAREIGDQVPFLVDEMSNGMMSAYDTYPFRVFAVAPDGTVAVTSDKGASGFTPTLERIDAWLAGRPTEAAEGESTMQDRQAESTTVFDFSSGGEAWPSIDDPVMGGLSRSRMRLDGGIAIFEGVVSLENNGGFASLRSRPAEHDLGGHDGVVLRLRGDGKTYGVRLRTSSSFDGVSYQVKVATEAGRWIEARLPFESFRPVFRGRVVRGHPALDPGAIRTLGLIISDGQEGPFRLEIDWIAAYRDARP